jgi:multimeric flavodoxin WrbA
MKILGILGSPRGKNSQTLRLANAFAEGVKASDVDVELVDICRLKIEYCRACDVCHRTGRCVHKDDFVALRERLLAADGIMLSSPDYFRTVTAQLKTMIDRMSDAIHCQLLAGKYACSLATAGGPEGEEVVTYLNGILVSMGAFAIGGVAASVSAGGEAFAAAERKARQLGADLCKAIAEKRVFPEQRGQMGKNAARFRQLVTANKDRWPYEFECWTKQASRAK